MEKYFIKKHIYLRGVYQAQRVIYIIYVNLCVHRFDCTFAG